MVASVNHSGAARSWGTQCVCQELPPAQPTTAFREERFRGGEGWENRSNSWEWQAGSIGLGRWHSFLTGRDAGCGNGSSRVESWVCQHLRLKYFSFTFNRNHCGFSQRKKHDVRMEMLVPELHRDLDESLHWLQSDLGEQEIHWGNTLSSFPINPKHRNAYCPLLANKGPWLDIQNSSFSLKDLWLHGGKEKQRERLPETSVLAPLTASYGFTHTVVLRHSVLGITTCRWPKACQSKGSEL